MRKSPLFVRCAAVAVALTSTLAGAGAVLPADATGVGDLTPDLQAVRAATAKFHSVDQAVAAGYYGDVEECASSPEGAMGIHFVNFAKILDPTLDPLSPEALLYLPAADGSLNLAAVEYAQVDADQNLATDDDRPSLFGQPFDGPMPGHGPGMPIHYDLHVWLWTDNPAGMFHPWNPAASC